MSKIQYKNRGANAIIVSLIAGYLLLSGLIFLLFYGGARRNSLLDRLLFEQEIGRILSMVRISPFLEGDMDIDDVNLQAPISIIGIGLYDAGGNAIFGMGEFPDTRPPLEGSEPEFQRFSTEFIYIRSFSTVGRTDREFSLFPRPPETPPETDQRRPTVLPGGQALPATIYLRGRWEDPVPPPGRIWLIYLAVEILLAAAFAAFGSMYLKNSRYRRQLEDQRQLVHLGQAARTLTHEIKNPLSAIGLRLSLLKRSAGEETREDLAIIQEELDRLNELSSRIREFLKQPGGNPENVNLREFLPDLIKRIPGEAKLSLDIAPGLGASVSMDPHRLRSVLENLLINAYEACGECEFELILQRHRRDIIMRILDRGPGITPEDLERIFDPFFTTKTRGSGIGLAIARQFVNAAGGTLDYLPREGGGSEFRIVLKAAADGAADSEGENQ